MNVVFSIMIVIMTLLLIGILILRYKNTRLEEEIDIVRREKYKDSNKYSMIEYYVRSYKEGKNPYTTLRDIQNIIYIERDDT